MYLVPLCAWGYDATVEQSAGSRQLSDEETRHWCPVIPMLVLKR